MIWSHLKRCRGKSLNEVFLLEYSLAVNLTKQFEFQEGVRSVLIDKDYQPNWKYPLSKIENIKPEKNDIEEILKINSKRKKLC